ncbi:MAG: NADH-ubiquinone oxidoreductase-F iron-sulfur binding region domain-containing protein [Candidatus Kapabacteria bacterium]|nr:NADH-ubiquinone oxidoreductase-F iron-sulfur binding region domain-containing protein [Candidatus Kapabacteria bacterium]
MPKVIENYNKLKSMLDFASTDAKSHDKIIIQVGSATCENAAGAEIVKNEFMKLIAASGRNDILIKQTGCTGRCSQEPIVGVFAPNHFAVKYQKVTVEKVAEIFQKNILGGKPVPSLMLDKRTDILYEHVVTFCETNYEKRPDHVDLRELFISKLINHGFHSDSVRVLSGGNIGLSRFEDDDKHALMIVFPENVIYRYETEEAMDEIITTHLIGKEICTKYLVQTEQLTEDYMRFYGDVSFFNKQSRITLRNCGIIDPENLADYIHAQGYKALANILDKSDRNDVIDEITKSGLRGRGGGGFPTGIKWKNTATMNPDPIKYVICNADEGDPGAFMDRSALEGDPFSIIEGMTIGAYAMGASKGYFYIRAEYPLAIDRIEKALKLARENNLLGDNILGSDFSLDLEIRLGAGAFVCGEETALIHSIEGKRGQPRIRPPYPSLSGLWGHPTSINNVETWANVPAIMLYGSDWFNRIGTKGSKGTKVFALAGKVKNTGLIEVPMGTTLREVIYDIGGGIFADGKLKAIQTGGPSGGCIPASKVDTPIDYETLKEIGSMMGSGGMIVLDEKDCMVNTAKFFLEFTKDESCGKCLPCREGTFRMLEILEKISDGRAVIEDLDKLERLGKIIKTTSLCGLGQTAANPVLSMMANFREEFEIHINEHRCPTQSCKKLISYFIIADKCTGCTLCARRCPVFCITGGRKQIHQIVQQDCIKCGECYNACKFDAIEKI